MFLIEFITKLLLNNSDTLFTSLIIIAFAYYGWLLWNINNHFLSFQCRWEKHEDKLNEIKEKMNDLDESVYKELISKLNDHLLKTKELKTISNEISNSQGDYREEIIDEIKESASEIKEIMKILLDNRSRSLSKAESKNDIRLNKGDINE